MAFLDKELQELVVYMGGPAQMPDILAKVPAKTGRDIWLILHVEIQGPGGGDLPERMFHYNSSLRTPVSYTHLRAHETVLDLVCRLLLEKINTYEHA